MAVITLEDAKVLLQITGTSKDDLIELLIPRIEAFIRKECNQAFTTWPDGIDLVAAQMIGFQMSQMAGGGGSIGLQSESQGEYSYTRGQGGANGAYPDSIMKALSQWKITRVHFGTVRQQNMDRRGMELAQLAADEYADGVAGEKYEDS